MNWCLHTYVSLATRQTHVSSTVCVVQCRINAVLKVASVQHGFTLFQAMATWTEDSSKQFGCWFAFGLCFPPVSRVDRTRRYFPSDPSTILSPGCWISGRSSGLLRQLIGPLRSYRAQWGLGTPLDCCRWSSILRPRICNDAVRVH